MVQPAASPAVRNLATSSIGVCVADSPMRCSGRSATAASRSSVSARCAPRREPMTAWISSTITVRTVRSICRLRSDVSSRYSDSGVVTRMCGGVRSIAARSAWRRIAGPHGRGDPRRAQPGLFGQAVNARARLREVLVDVGAERLERRHVDDADLVRQRRRVTLFEQRVDGGEERRQRLARAGGRGDQRVPAGGDRVPAAQLRGGRLADFGREPLTDDGMETSEGHGRGCFARTGETSFYQRADDRETRRLGQRPAHERVCGFGSRVVSGFSRTITAGMASGATGRCRRGHAPFDECIGRTWTSVHCRATPSARGGGDDEHHALGASGPAGARVLRTWVAVSDAAHLKWPHS